MCAANTTCLSPYSCSSLAVPTLAARSCSSIINFSGSIKQDECAFHISFTARKLWLIT
jgi:hypothetical protein